MRPSGSRRTARAASRSRLGTRQAMSRRSRSPATTTHWSSWTAWTRPRRRPTRSGSTASASGRRRTRPIRRAGSGRSIRAGPSACCSVRAASPGRCAAQAAETADPDVLDAFADPDDRARTTSSGRTCSCSSATRSTPTTRRPRCRRSSRTRRDIRRPPHKRGRRLRGVHPALPRVVGRAHASAGSSRRCRAR